MPGRRPVTLLLALLALLAPAALRPTPAHAALPSLAVAGNHLTAGGSPIALHGVNRSGTEYACIQGWGVFDGPSDAASVQAIAGWHANIVRVLLNEDCWLGINGVATAYGGADYQQAVISYVNLLHANGLYAEVSLIWAAPGAYPATYQPAAPDADHSPAMWAGMAAAFAGDPAVILAPWGETTVGWGCFRDGCSNEATYGPSNVTYSTAGMQQAVTVMRQNGFTGPIAIPCIDYANDCADGAGSWSQYMPSDPQHSLVAEAHIYGNNSCGAQNAGACLTSTIAPLTASVPVIFGEAGETYDDSECSSSNMQVILPWADQHGVGWEAWTWDTWGDCLSLVSSYDGTPNTGAPAGAAYAAYVHQHLLGYTPAPPAPPPTAAGTYHPVPPARLLDTRLTGTPLAPNSTLRFDVAAALGKAPSSLTAAVLNVTATGASAPGYLAVDSGTVPNPGTSNVNFGAGQQAAAMVQAQTDSGGYISVYNGSGASAVEVVIDAMGWIAPTADGSAQLKATAPRRVLDTRGPVGGHPGQLGPNGRLDLQVVAPLGAVGPVSAVVVNLTVTNGSAPGYVTAFPQGGALGTSNLNYGPWQVVANRAIVEVPSDGEISIYNGSGVSGVDVIVDVTGYFTTYSPAGAGLATTIQPRRVLDTRTAIGGHPGPLAAGTWTPIAVGGIPAGAQAAVVTVTATDATVPAYLELAPAAGAASTSDLDLVPGAQVANLAVAPLDSSGRVWIYVSAGSLDAILDVAGWYS